LLARDVSGALLNKMNTTVDGEFQRYTVEDGNYIRENFFGPDPRLREMVSHLTDAELQALPRGGHDYRKVYAAFKAAADNLGSGRPTAILAKTVKGWTLGPEIEGRNATHQIKKMNVDQLRQLRDRLHLNDEITDQMLEGDVAPYYRPPEDSVEYQYLIERRRALDGFVPRRISTARRKLTLPSDDAFRESRRSSHLRNGLAVP
jgi:pyruvate dehydrogenase E1 component